MSSWDKFDHRYISCYRLKSLSAYSMFIYAFFRVCGGMIWKTRVPPTRSPIWSYIFLFLFTASSSESLLSSALKPSSSSLGSCPLRCPVEQRWELAKMCRKDKCCFGPLGLRGLRLRRYLCKRQQWHRHLDTDTIFIAYKNTRIGGAAVIKGRCQWWMIYLADHGSLLWLLMNREPKWNRSI